MELTISTQDMEMQDSMFSAALAGLDDILADLGISDNDE